VSYQWLLWDLPDCLVLLNYYTKNTMLTYILTLLGLPILCVVWVIFQSWLAKKDPDYKGYKAGCGGCSQSDSCSGSINHN